MEVVYKFTKITIIWAITEKPSMTLTTQFIYLLKMYIVTISGTIFSSHF